MILKDIFKLSFDDISLLVYTTHFCTLVLHPDTLLNLFISSGSSTMGHHIMPVRMAIIKMFTNNKYWKQCRENRTLLNS